jgi:excisionase family DNA binding protein
MSASPTIERQSLSVAEFAAANGLSSATVYRLVHAGEIPAVRYGKSIRIPVDGR